MSTMTLILLLLSAEPEYSDTAKKIKDGHKLCVETTKTVDHPQGNCENSDGQIH